MDIKSFVGIFLKDAFLDDFFSKMPLGENKWFKSLMLPHTGG